MGDRDDGTADGPKETLQGGPARPPLLQSVPARWRQRAAVPVALVLGIAAGAGAVLWWQAEQEPTPTPASPPFRADEHAVELILFQAAPPWAEPGSPGSETTGPLHIDATILLSGTVTSTVSGIETPDDSLEVRAAALPVTVSPTDRLRSVELRISVRDCETATRWEPTDRPFVITWRDEFDRMHTDRAGDLGRSTASSLIRYIDAVCDNP